MYTLMSRPTKGVSKKRPITVTMLSSSVRSVPNAKNPYRNTIGLLIAIVVILAGGLLYAWVKSSHPQPTPPSSEKTEN